MELGDLELAGKSEDEVTDELGDRLFLEDITREDLLRLSGGGVEVDSLIAMAAERALGMRMPK